MFRKRGISGAVKAVHTESSFLLAVHGDSSNASDLGE